MAWQVINRSISWLKTMQNVKSVGNWGETLHDEEKGAALYKTFWNATICTYFLCMWHYMHLLGCCCASFLKQIAKQAAPAKNSYSKNYNTWNTHRMVEAVKTNWHMCLYSGKHVSGCIDILARHTFFWHRLCAHWYKQCIHRALPVLCFQRL